MIFISILLVFTSLTHGCISHTANPIPMTSQPPAISSESFANYGGTSLGIAFKGDEISTSSPEAKELFIKGLTYLTQYGQYNESLKYFDDALAIDQNFTEAWMARGVAHHNMKRYDEAIKCYDKALELNPLEAGIWHVKGVTLYDWGKYEDSAECNKRAAELDPRYGIR